MSTIYSANLSVAKKAAKRISELHITRFHTQNALYVFIEDIKNPSIKTLRDNRNPKAPAYHPGHNYDPIINYLEKHDVLVYKNSRVSKSGWTTQYEIEVDKDALTHFIERHNTVTKAI